MATNAEHRTSLPLKYAYEDESRSSNDGTKIVHVSNVSSAATLEQMTTLFGFLGDIVNIELYQNDTNLSHDQAQQQQQQQQQQLQNFKVCFVEFAKSSSVVMAQHLTNTVFIDRALTVLPYNKQLKIPDKETALMQTLGLNTITNFNTGVVNQVMNGVGGTQVITTIDPKLTALALPQYPQLPVNTDPTRIEEIRRTVYIGNLDSTIPPDLVLKFFNDIGEVKYIRMAGDDTQPTRFAFVEFTHQASVANALQHNGFILGSRALKINHSNNAIVKPQLKIEPLDERRTIERDDHRRSHHFSSRYDRERDRDRYHQHDRHSSRSSRSRRSKSRDSSRSRESRRSRDRSRSRDSRRSRERSRSRDSKRSSRRRSHTSSSKSSSSRHHKSSRR